MFHFDLNIKEDKKAQSFHLQLKLFSLNVEGVFSHSFAYDYKSKLESWAEVFQLKKHLIEKHSFLTSERYWHYLHHLLPTNQELVTLLDACIWDWYSQLKKKTISELLSNKLNFSDEKYTLEIRQSILKDEQMLNVYLHGGISKTLISFLENQNPSKTLVIQNERLPELQLTEYFLPFIDSLIICSKEENFIRAILNKMNREDVILPNFLDKKINPLD